MAQIEIFFCTPNEGKDFVMIENTVEQFKSLVGEQFEIISLFGLIRHKIVLVSNPQARINGYSRSLWIGSEWIHGDCFLAKLVDNGFISLDELDKQAILEWMSDAEYKY